MKILLLDDQGDSYPNSNDRWPGFDCDDKRLDTVAKKQQVMKLKNIGRQDPMLTRLHTYIVEKLRVRYWFVVALDCSGIDRTIEYELHLRNPKQGWLSEVSMDHCGILTLGFFLFVYLGTSLLQVKAVFTQSTARTKHPLRLLLTFGMLSALWSTVFFTFDTYWYATRGEDSWLMYVLSKLSKAFSKFTLLLIAILLSKGRAITHELHLRDIMHAAIIVTPLVTLSWILEIWGEYDQSRLYTTNWIYSSWAGIVIILLDLVLLALYGSNLHRTWREEADEHKKQFYRTWGCVYSSAFLNLPVSAIVACFVSAHVRVEVMFIFNNSIHSLLMTLLMLGLWPEHSQSVFNIDKSLACTFGNPDEELKSGLKGDYSEFLEDHAQNI